MAKLDPDKTHRNITYHKGRSPGSQVDSIESGSNPSQVLTQWNYVALSVYRCGGSVGVEFVNVFAPTSRLIHFRGHLGGGTRYRGSSDKARYFLQEIVVIK